MLGHLEKKIYYNLYFVKQAALVLGFTEPERFFSQK
jgi:hypothetical protein